MDRVGGPDQDKSGSLPGWKQGDAIMTSVIQNEETASEAVDTSKVPYRVADELLIPAARYHDHEFFEVEKNLWKHSWQLACHGTEIPKTGDFTEYKILDQSIMLIRQKDGSVKGFHNACRHRGTAIACGSGTFRADQVVCPFHGWRWNLEGKNTYVYAKDAFREDTVKQEDIDLAEVQVALRWGFVWINLDTKASAFEDAIHGIAGPLDGNGFEKAHITWWHQIEFEANWKIAQEAFFEAYHVMQAHPEMAGFTRDEDFNALAFAHYKTDPQGHGWADSRAPRILQLPGQDDTLFVDPKVMTPGMKFYTSAKVMWEGSQSQTNAHYIRIMEDLLDLTDAGEFFSQFFTRAYMDAAERGVDLTPRRPDTTGHWAMFPNFTGVAMLGCSLVYRSRPHPTDPNKCIYDFFALEIPPTGTPVKKPQIGADDAPTWDDLWFVQQDASNIERMQTGIRSSQLEHIRLGVDVERLIVNWHQALDRELAKYV